METQGTGNYTRIALIFLVSLIAVQWLLSLVVGFNEDAGYYLSYGIEIARGATPGVDFESQYPYGSFYLLSLLGETGLATPYVVRLGMFGLSAGAAWLIFSILRAQGHARGQALFFAVLFHACVISLDGKMVVLEPFQNLFLLVAVLVLLKRPDPVGAACAGVALGASLMMKQYSILLFPALTWMAWQPLAGERFAPDRPLDGLIRVVVFGLCIPLPFLLFVLATGQDFLHAFLQVSTFGGVAGDYASTISVVRNLNHFTGSLSAIFVIPVGVLYLWLLFMDRSWRFLGLGLAMAFAVMPQIVRQHAHNAQLVVPWSLLIVAAFVRELSKKLGDRADFQDALRVALAVAMVPLILRGVALEVGFAAQERFRAATHQAVAAQIIEELPSREDVLVLNFTWIYPMAGLTPPDSDYRWPHSIGYTPMDATRDKARFAVLMPSRKEDLTRQRNWLEAGGLELFQELPSVWGKPIQLFRRPGG